jgi:outer membrane receptor protein involved in Fe transport
MNRKVLLFTFFLCLFTFSLSSKTPPNLNFTVKGLVTDSVSKESIPYVTISIATVEKPDVYLKRIASGAKGDFELAVTNTGNYRISFESVGMTKHTRTITLSPEQKTLNLGKITLAASNKNLSEVTVTALKPLIKVDLDKITYDIKSDPEAKSTTTLDMLRKVPMVTVDGDDKIQLKGSSSFKVYINGKPSGMMTRNASQALKSMPATSVKSIEVITEPGAKYDAEGLGGIINIVTDKALTGITGTVRAGTDTRGSNNGGLYFSSKLGKFGLTANLNYNDQKNPQNTYFNERENLKPQSVSFITQNSRSNSSYNFGYGSIEASYEIDSLNLISYSLNGNLGGSTNNSSGKTAMLDSNRDTLSAFNQQLYSTGNWGGVDMSLDYQRTFKKPDQLFTLSYRYSHTPDNSDNNSDLTGLHNYTSSKQHTQSEARGDEHTFQSDYSEPFHKIHVIEFGAKFILRLNNSNNTYMQQIPGSAAWVPIVSRPENNLDQTQDILGAYGSYTLKLKKLSLRAGLRYEQTWSNVLLTDTSFKFNFQNLIPSVTMSYKFNESSSVRLSYNQRISRPGIWYLNPYVDNSNPSAIQQGNPDLNPEISNSFSVNFSNITPKLTINTNLYTAFTNNSIERVSSLLNDSTTFTTFKNIGLSTRSGLSLSVNWQPSKLLRINGNGSGGYVNMSTNDGSGLKNKGVNYGFQAGVQYTLPYELKLSMNGGYSSPNISLQGNYSGYYYYNTSLSHDFFNKKLNVNLRASNFITKTRSFNSSMATTEYKSNTIYSYVFRNFGVTVVYSFGKLKEQIKKVQRTIENSDIKGGGQSNGGGQ